MVLICHLYPGVIEVVRKLILDDDTLTEYMQEFIKELNLGLDEKTCEKAEIKTQLTYVNKTPSGLEEGNFIALHFSGSLVRVMLVSMLNKECTVTAKSFEVTDAQRTGKANRLFHFIAKCVASFLIGLKLHMLRIPLGFAFGFPFEQDNLQEGKLLRWTGGFTCDEAIGQNIPDRLRRAFRRFPELKRVYIIGVLSESTSALLAASWQDPRCKVGLVVGYGAGLSYIERVSRVTKYHAATYSEKTMMINLEPGSLGDGGKLDFVRSSFDEELDLNSQHPGQQLNEKMISLSYLGEVARLALVKCIREQLILGGVLNEKITTPNSLTVYHLSKIESDPQLEKHDGCREVMAEFKYNVSDDDCIQIQFVCRCVSRRSANLIASQLAGLINRIGKPFVGVAASGELIKEYPNYLWYVTKKVRQLKSPNIKYKIIVTEDDAVGRGAAVAGALFGKEAMEREAKLRTLPPYLLDQCHFNKYGTCLNPNCKAKHPDGEEKGEKEQADDKEPKNPFARKIGPCHGYDIP